MATLFARLDVSLQGGQLSASLTGQATKLSGVVGAVTDLIQHPPQGLADLGAQLNAFPVPSMAVGGNFAATLNGIQSAVPADLSSVTGAVTGALANLGDLVENDLAKLLKQVLDVIAAVYRLTQLDPSCASATRDLAGSRAAAPDTLSALDDQVQRVQELLDAAPDPLDAPGLLGWLREASGSPKRERLMPIPLPVVDELVDPLQTLEAWRAMTPAQVADHLAATVQALRDLVQASVTAQVTDLGAAVTASAANLHADALRTIAVDLDSALAALRSAVLAGDLSGSGPAVAQINARLDELAALQPSLTADVVTALPALTRRLSQTDVALDDRMAHLVTVLAPGAASDFLGEINAPQALAADAFGEVQQGLSPITQWLSSLTEALDISALQQPLASAAQGVNDAADAVDQGLAGITLQVRTLLGQLTDLVDQVDTSALSTQVQSAIDDFRTTLTQQLQALFAPVRQALGQVVQDIDDHIGEFDPSQIEAPLRQAVDDIAAVLDDPQVKQALGRIRTAIDSAAQRLQEISFTPLTDQVISAMDQLAEALRAIEPQSLNIAAQGALQAALAILPPSLQPITDPLLDEFATLVDEGPGALAARVAGEPQRLLARVQQFDPSNLVADTLGQPFQSLLGQMQSFAPSQLLAPVSQELDKLKARLQRDANPGSALAPLEAPFAQILAAFDRLDPATMLQPVQQALDDAVDRVTAVLPVDEVLGQVDAALGQVERIIDLVSRMVAIPEKIEQMLGGLSGARDQVTAWVDEILDKVAAIADPSALHARLAELASALDATRGAALAGALDSAAAPVLATLADLDPEARITALVQAQGAFPNGALAALPDSPEKTALQAALGRLDPLDASFAQPYQTLAAYRGALATAHQRLQASAAGWDARYHAADGTLAGLRVGSPSPATLRDWLAQALEPQFVRPWQALLAVLEALAGPIAAIAAVLRQSADALTGRASALVNGPGSLSAIRDSLQALVARLHGVNLDVVRDGLAGVFGAVRTQLTALDPAALRNTVEDAFAAMLAQLTLEQILPPADISQLDSDYQGLITRLQGLDPATLVGDVVKPAFQQKVTPLLANFDLTPVLQSVTARLDALADELKSELARVDQAYRALRDAVPSMSLSLDVDVELPF